MNKINKVHPGEILLEEFLKPMNISQYKLAKDIGVGGIRVNQIVNGKRSITPDTALRLGIYFGTSPEFWMNLQSRYDLECLVDLKGAMIEEEVNILIKK